MKLEQERKQVIEYGKKLIENGLTVGTFGNVSVYNREENLMAISPSGMDYYKITPADVVVMTPDGEKVEGDCKPSSEVDMHRIFYQKRPEVGAVIHTHSTFATTLACMHKSVPPIHYLVAYSGRKVPCIPYVQFGTYELAQTAFDAMAPDGYSCILGNHGLLSVGGNIGYAFDVAQQIEFLCELYYRTLLAGGPTLMKDEDIDAVIKQFEHYRQR